MILAVGNCVFHMGMHCPAAVVSLIGRLMQSSQDLRFGRPLCSHDSKYYIMVYLAHILAVGVPYKTEATAWGTLMHAM